MTSKWSPCLPSKPGRYFFRDTKTHYYGACLVAWDKGHAHSGFERQPELRVRSWSIFGSQHPEAWRNEGMGELTNHPGWSYGSENNIDGIEFCELTAPPGFPEIPGRPDDIPTEVIAASKKRDKEERKATAAREREAAKLLKDDIADAVTHGTDLYQCDDCEKTWDELVTGKMRECPHCCTGFVEYGGCRNCPDCNRPFTRLEETKETCPDCHDSGEMPDMTLLVSNGVVQKP